MHLGSPDHPLVQQIKDLQAESVRQTILHEETRRALEHKIADLASQLQKSRETISEYRKAKRELQERLRNASVRLREKAKPKSLLSRFFERPHPANQAPEPTSRNTPKGTGRTGKDYDVIASLGSWCGPAFNIREYYRTTKATPFDWWISDYDATVKVLEDDFENIMRLENLEILDGVYPRETVRCRHYGLRHHHDFKREGDQGNGDGYHAAAPVIDDLASQIENAQQKTQFILNRFRDTTRDADVLMVRHEPHVYSDDRVALRLYEAFVRCFNPRTLDLLIISTEDRTSASIEVDRGSIILEPLGSPIEPALYPFNQKNFTAIFDNIGATLRKENPDRGRGDAGLIRRNV
jgi:hypothetical protein